MSNTTKADAATELMRGALRLNLSFLRDRFAGNDEAQAAIQAFDTGLVALLLRFETALAAALADTTAERQAAVPVVEIGVIDFADPLTSYSVSLDGKHVADWVSTNHGEGVFWTLYAVNGLRILRDGQDVTVKRIDGMVPCVIGMLQAGYQFTAAKALAEPPPKLDPQTVGRALREPPAPGSVVVLDFDAAPIAPPIAKRRTLTVPPGHVVVRDSDGRATGETKPVDIRIVESAIDKDTMGVLVNGQYVANFKGGTHGPFWYLHTWPGNEIVRYGVTSIVAETVRDMPSAVRGAINMGVKL